MIAEVIVDIASADVDKIFDYSFDDCRIVCGSRVVVPFGRSAIEGIVVKIKDNTDCPPEKLKKILRLLEEIPALTEETLKLADYVSKKYYVSHAAALRLFLPVEMRKGKVREQFTKFLSVKVTDKDSALGLIGKKASKQIELFNYLFENGKSVFTEMNKRFGASAVKGLLNKDLIVLSSEKYFREPYKNLTSDFKKVNLTEAQKNTIESIEKTDKTVTLVFGVTGSGKTEVYLDLIDKTIGNDKTAIMLVPEISLTPQMLKQLRARFGYSAAILHSGLSAGERFDEWWRLRTGEAKIAIGARSAIFAPLENLGLIIIDEEHDGSYKSESSPRYSTLDVASERAKLSKAKIVLGSATPSVESYLNAVKGEYNLSVLSERINKKPLPNIEIVDMRKEIRRGNNSPFSQALVSELKNCINNGNQAILFLNQRGYSKTVICTECGHVQTCEMCDVSLTYHKEDESMLCHYCGAKYKMIKACTECGSPFIRHGGFGTERIVIELKKLFPSAKILRMDRDTTQTKEGHFKILSEFSNRKADILVGTQMIAKGHDFPSVTLVGILDADMSLHFSDYRSAERTFQLITQVSGRSGRAKEAGKVVLQTYQPNNSLLLQAVRYDYKGFFEHEVSVRKATCFPPFANIVRVLVSASNEETALSATKDLYLKISELYQNNKESFKFFGCMKAPINKLQGKFRFQILMRILPERKDIIDKIYEEVALKNGKTLSVYLEINPNNLI